MPAGAALYDVGCDAVLAHGTCYTDQELDAALAGAVSDALMDEPGTTELDAILAGAVTTQFSVESLKRTLSAQQASTAWQVGEGIAEAFLVHHRGCEFPWPSRRDLRNPSASPAGADLVGFHNGDEPEERSRFAFGEVKTSGEEAWPPAVVTGGSGLRRQLTGLRDRTSTKDALVLYLGHRAQGADWRLQYRCAAERYLADPTDVSLFGVIVRDVEPRAGDLKQLAEDLASGCPSVTSVELHALYLPSGVIETLPARAAKAREGRDDHH